MGVEKLRLTALRAFDLVARTGSFTRAAAALNVTRPAISKQIKSLEDELGAPLITRYGPKLTLTEAGEMLASGLHQGFDLISAAAARVAANIDQPRTIRILVERDFATSWLALRIGDFMIRNPGLPVEITSDQNGQMRSHEDFSFRIFYGPAGRVARDEMAEIFLCDWVDLPICTPEYARRHAGDHGFVDARFLLDRNYNPWEDWFARTGIKAPDDPAAYTRFNETTLCLQAAQGGAGVTMGDTLMSLAALESGQMVVPFKTGLTSREHYALCFPRGRELTEAELTFQSWLVDAVATYQARTSEALSAHGIAVLS